MSDDHPQKIYIVQHVDGVPRPFEAGDEIRVYEGVVVDETITVSAGDWGAPPSPGEHDLEGRRAIANRDLPVSLRRLDALTDPVSRAVLDLHARRPAYDRWECDVCCVGNDMGDRMDWPCDTVETVAGVHGIPLDDFWFLRRPDDGSLDQRGGEPA